MRYIFSILLCVILQTGFSQIIKTVGYSYTNGTPTYTPAKAGSALALDTVTWRYYTWNGSTWLSDGFRIQTISGCSAPAYAPTKFQSYLVINACTAGQGGPELYKYNGSAWECLNCSSGLNLTAGAGITLSGAEPDITISNSAPDISISLTEGDGIDVTGAYPNFTVTNTSPNGPDSALALTSGQYWGKILNSNVYKNGTLGIRSVDTFGVLNLSELAGVKPMINLNSNSAFLINSPRDTRGNSGLIQNFAISKSFNDSASTSGDNQVIHYGFNVGPGGTVYDPTKSALWLSMENSYNVPGGSAYRAYEFHFPQLLYPSGAVRRPFTGYYSNNESVMAGFTSLANDFLSFGDFKTNTQRATWGFGEVNGNQPYNKGITFRDTAAIYFEKSWLSGGVLLGRKFDNSGYIRMLTTNTSDEIILGGSGETSIVAINSLKVSGAGTIWNDGNNITIGKSGSLATLNLYGNVLMKWGPTFGGDIFQHRIDGNDWTMFAYGSSTFMWYVSKNAPSNAFSIAGTTGNLGLGIRVGLAKIHAVSTSGATNKMIRVENTTGLNDVYRSNATPESAITGNQGDLAITNISSAGRLWLKKTGTGNTGWKEVVTTDGSNASAALEITSTTQGFLPPRMTQAQRDAISSPATGLTVYCTDCTAFDLSTGVMVTWNGATWKTNW